MSEAVATRPCKGSTWAAVLTGLAAAVAGVAAATMLWQPPSVTFAASAMLLHVFAAVLARQAAQFGGAVPCELDLVLVLALVAPLFGPGLSWILVLRSSSAGTRNAHAVFEAEHGDETEDAPELERELQVVSHAQVLRHGSLEEKRNLLRQLARIGERRYLLLLRRFLLDDEPELRLCAYAELAHVCQQQEQAIRELRTRAESVTGGEAQLAAARAELAEANRAYATSGLLDDDMAAYWFEQARRIAVSALEADSESLSAQRVLALSLAELGHHERAWQIVADWPDQVQPEHDLARAELAFRRRDRSTCVAVAERLLAASVELPPWLIAVLGDRHDHGVDSLPTLAATAVIPQDQAVAR